MDEHHLFPETRISLFPRPVVIVTSVGNDGRVGATTISWTGILSSRPPVIGVSFLPDSFTRSRIVESREFVVNVPDDRMVAETNYLGSVTGPWELKLAGLEATLGRGLTLAPSRAIRSPRIAECYLSFECRMLQSVQIGLYDCFLGEVINMSCRESCFSNDHPRGNIDYRSIHPVFCLSDGYWTTSDTMIGKSTENKTHPHGPQH